MSIARTALIAWDYPPNASGLAVAAREIAESLVEAGIDVTVFTLDRAGEDRLNGVRIIGCAPGKTGLSAQLRRRMALGHLVAPRWFAQTVATVHRRDPFDCLEATNWYAPGALARRLPNLAFVTRHSTPAAFTGALEGGSRDRLDGRFACWLEAASARAADGHLFNTEAHGKTIAALYRLGTDRPRAVAGLSLPPERVAAAKAAPAPGEGGPVEILFVGRCEARKGFDLLVEAVDILAGETARGDLAPFRLSLVGVGADDLSMMSPDARGLVRPLGRLSEAALDAAYGRAHLVLAPSRYESFGLVYYEGLAFGRPVIALAGEASACQAIGESGGGLLADEASGPALAATLRRAIADPGLRATLRERALRAGRMFSRAELARRTLSVYRAADEHRRSLRQGGVSLEEERP